MKQFCKKLVLLCFIFLAPIQADDSCSNSVTSHLSIRSQSVNLPRIASGWNEHVHIFEQTGCYATFAITPGYSQSFRSKDLARCLFGGSLQGCDCPQITISGSQFANRGSCDWLADYFGLPTDFKSSITFKPKISNAFVDFSFHVGFDEWVDGLWFRAWTPFVHTKWDLDFCEKVSASGVNDHELGYFSSTAVSRDQLLKKATDFFQGKTLSRDTTRTNMESLCACRWNDCGCDTDLTQNGLADIRFALGWNFWQTKDHHVGLGVMAAAPTGTRSTGDYLFEPVIGNGYHWELGAAFTAHATFWKNEEKERFFDGYIDANVTHLFKSRQRRCFDLCGKPMSRYMLAESMSVPVDVLFAITGDTPNPAPSAQYSKTLAPVANLTCSDVNVSVGVQADVVATLNYTHKGFSWNLGYNLWARSCEKIKLAGNCPSRLAQKDSWALKGDAYLFGFQDNSQDSVNGQPVPLSATESKATIYTGTNWVSPFTEVITCNDLDAMHARARLNEGIDNPQIARAAGSEVAFDGIISSPDTNGCDMHTSYQPQFINQCDINFNSGRSKALTHSVFTHLSYSWFDKGNRVPYIGVGAQAEFANNSGSSNCNKCCPTSCSTSSSSSSRSAACKTKSSCKSCCDSCIRCAVSQWSVWVKGGISFN